MSGRPRRPNFKRKVDQTAKGGVPTKVSRDELEEEKPEEQEEEEEEGLPAVSATVGRPAVVLSHDDQMDSSDADSDYESGDEMEMDLKVVEKNISLFSDYWSSASFLFATIQRIHVH